MNESDKSIIDQTLEFWQSRSEERLTRESARQIVANISGFFQVLADWDTAQSQAVATKQNASEVCQSRFKRAVNDDCDRWKDKPFSEN